MKWELYDLAADPKESNDLLAAEPQRATTMKKELTAWLESVVRRIDRSVGAPHLGRGLAARC